MAAASPHLARLGARARPVGSEAIADARAHCRTVLVRAGLIVQERSFEFSAFGGEWAMPFVGLAAPLLATLAVAARPAHASLSLVAGILLVACIAFAAYSGRDGAVDLPLMRRRGTNLEATRGTGAPPVWLVAHLDSKWQAVPMAGRVAGIVFTSIALVATAAATIAGSSAAWPLATIVWLTSIPLMLSVHGARNHGTVDNASGVAAVLEAVEQLPPRLPLGVLITDAEEYSLPGARAWARAHVGSPGIALNCDSVDDDGLLTVMYSGDRGRADRLSSRLAAAAAAIGEPLRVTRLVPGVLVDSVALVDAGWTSVTLSRGTLRTLGRIHTSRDTLDWMSGTGIRSAATVLARTVASLAEEST